MQDTLNKGTYRHKDTGNQVKFKSLPLEQQKQIRQETKKYVQKGHDAQTEFKTRYKKEKERTPETEHGEDPYDKALNQSQKLQKKLHDTQRDESDHIERHRRRWKRD